MIKEFRSHQSIAQYNKVVDQSEMPPCVGNPHMICRGGPNMLVIKGYDDKYRCEKCNELHIELVMKEAGKSSPNSEPKFVAAKLDKRAEAERMARMQSLSKKLEDSGHSRASEEEIDSYLEKHNQTQNMDPEMRRQAILAKYRAGRK